MDDATVAIEVDGETEEIELPGALIEALSEPGEAPATVVADVALMAFTGRAHALVHHAEDGADERLEDAEERMLDAFETRFGVTYAEATGHSH